MRTVWGDHSASQSFQPPFNFQLSDGFFSKLPTPHQIERLQKYAGLIEFLRLGDYDQVHSSVLNALKFSNLKIVEYALELTKDVVMNLAPLCGPKLKCMLLCLDEMDGEDEEDDDDEEDIDPHWGFHHC